MRIKNFFSLGVITFLCLFMFQAAPHIAYADYYCGTDSSWPGWSSCYDAPDYNTAYWQIWAQDILAHTPCGFWWYFYPGQCGIVTNLTITDLTTVAPPDVSLNVSSNNVQNGTPVTFSWSSNNAANCWNNFSGDGNGADSVQVWPPPDTYTTYYEACSNAGGTNVAYQGVTTYAPMCTSSANACGQTNYGACPQSPPANPAGYGNACTSPANSCGQTNPGTIQCNGTCSATTAPSNATCAVSSCTVNQTNVSVGNTVTYTAVGGGAPFTWTPSDGGGAYGSASTASRNFTSANAGLSYGMSVSTPGGSANCPNVNVAATWCTTGSAALTITATPDRVKAGSTSHIAWTGTNIQGNYANYHCAITGPGLNQSVAVGAAPSCSIPNGSSTVDPTISTQSTYTITCGADTKSVTVNVAPNFTEF